MCAPLAGAAVAGAVLVVLSTGTFATACAGAARRTHKVHPLVVLFALGAGAAFRGHRGNGEEKGQRHDAVPDAAKKSKRAKRLII